MNNPQNITAIIQARVASRRLPGKVLLPLHGKTVLEQVIDRVRRSSFVSEVIVATTIDTSDDTLAQFCKEKGIRYYRGSIDDVLDRYYQTAKAYKIKHICRITADCPLVDPELITLAGKKYLQGEYDYVAINRPLESATYPDGVDTEIFSFEALKKASQAAKQRSEREHVTPYIWKNPEMFRIYSFHHTPDLSEYRLTIDEEKDYELMKLIYAKVAPLTMDNVIEFLERNNAARSLNQEIRRDEGYYKSLEFENKK